MTSPSRNADRYRRLRLLGEGGAGRVWLAEDRRRSGRRVALKELSDELRDRGDSLRREFATLAALRHPNLIRVHEFGVSEEAGLPMFTLEYIDGDDLVTAVRTEGPGLLVPMAAEGLRALAFLHDFGLIHRDLKPQNLLIRRRERLGCRLVMLDFGLALQGRVEADRAARPGGTLPYMAPELFAGHPADRKTDLYALGVLLYEAVHGNPPYEPGSADLAEFIERVRAGTRSHPSVPEGYPTGLTAWLDELLSVDPADRPAGAREALERLNAACAAAFESETRMTRVARLASGSPPGREPEIEHLWTRLTGTDGPHLIFLLGDAGSGKTRLLRWLESCAVKEGWSAERMAGAIEFLSNPESSDSAGSEVMLTRLQELARAGPILVCCDEAESASDLVAGLVDRIGRSPTRWPFRIIVAARPAEIRHELIRRLIDDADLLPFVECSALSPLNESGIRRMAERSSGSQSVSREQVKWLQVASEGSPLVLEQLLIDEGWKRGARGRPHCTLAKSIKERMAVLPPQTRSWLEALVVLGGSTPPPLISAVADLTDEDAIVTAEEAAAARLAVEADGTWSPASRLLAEVMLDDLPRERFRSLHRVAAECVENSTQADGDADRLATLWARAGDVERGLSYATRAADQAEVAGRVSEAADHLALAVSLVGRRDPRRFDLRRRHADLLMRASRFVPAYRALATCLRYTKDPSQRANLLVQQAMSLAHLGENRRVVALAKIAQSLAAELELPAVIAKAAKARAMGMFRLAQFQQAVPILEEAILQHDAIDDTCGQAESTHLLALCKSRLREITEARGLFGKATELARTCGETRIEIISLVGLGNLESRAWAKATAIRHYESAKRLAEVKPEFKRQRVAVLNNLANGFMDLGYLSKSLALAEETEALARQIGARNWLFTSRLTIANTLTMTGRPAEAASVLTEVLSKHKAFESENLGYVKLTLAEALMDFPEPDEERITGLLEETLSNPDAEPKQTIAALLLEMERRARPGSGEPFDPIRRKYEKVVSEHRASQEPPLEIRAELALAANRIREGDAEQALRVAADAAELAEQKDVPDLAARAWSLHGEALQLTGDGAAARGSFERGRRSLDEAASRIGDDAMRRDFLDRPVFRALRADTAGLRADGEERLLAIYEMIRSLNSETDPEQVLETTLDSALKVVRAERGMILLRESGEDFRVRVARNLEQETIKDASEFSRHVVLEAGAGKAVLAVDTGQDRFLRELKSVSMYGIRSVLCVPLRSRERIIGAVYLDNRSDATLFTPDDLRFLEAFADHAALALENAQIRRELELENQRLQRAAESRVRFGSLIGRSPPMQEVYDLIRRVAETDLPVMIRGESGTGKELVARAIHFNGPRRRKPFIAENCAAVPENLLESELFGHVKGAFTGAERERSGLFEQAHGGTLMLDEIGDMPAQMQARLLRVLQEGEVRRVGGERTIQVDVRVLTATHRDLDAEVREGRFRQDLLYRLQVLGIPLPPLRDRTGDIPLLVEHFLGKIAAERGRAAPRLRSAVVDVLERYSWPGNIRQLENAMQRLVLLAGDGPITVGVVESDRDLRGMLMGATDETVPVYSLERTEENKIREALTAAGGNRTRAARLLGISRATIFRKIKQFGLS